MELAGVPTDDRNAGYIDEDESDIEYSDFEEGDWEVDSSDEEGRWQYLHEKLSGVSGNEEADFDKCMDDELTMALDAYIKGFDESITNKATKGTSDALLSLVDTQEMQESQTSMADTQESQISKETDATSSKPSHSQATDSINKATGSKDKKDEFYDDIYFSSGSSEGMSDGGNTGHGNKKQKKNKRRKLTNDELLYDPNMDKEDEKWVNRQRMAYHNVRVSQKLESQKKQSENPAVGGSDDHGAAGSSNSGGKQKADTAKIPKSDAILSCPACMSTLCIDCQRHVFYKNQYRAMFVLNCTILRDEVLHVKPPKKGQKQRKRKKSKIEAEEEDDSGPYRPVQCTICSTEVAVYDKDEIFHFFNVLPSAS